MTDSRDSTPFWSTLQIAEELGVTSQAVRNYVRSGLLKRMPCFGKRFWVFSADEYYRFKTKEWPKLHPGPGFPDGSRGSEKKA